MKRVGYRFLPTDEEIISYFLKHKMDGSHSSDVNEIAEIDLCKFEPWELPRYAAMEESSNDEVWYFFCPRHLKYPKSRRANRTTIAGYWKSTCKDRQIKATQTNNVIGSRKTLVFHTGRVPHGVRTNWVIHEYQSKTILPHQRAFTFCKLWKKRGKKTDTPACDEYEPSHSMPSDIENPVEAPIPHEDQELQVEPIVIGNGLGFQYPPAMQQQIHIEQGPSLENTPFTNGFGYESNEWISQFDSGEEVEDPIKLADSFLAEPECFSYRDVYTFLPPLNHSSPSKSLSRVNLEGDGAADIEVDHLESFEPLVNGRSKGYLPMQTIQTLTETLPSSIHDWHEKEEITSHQSETVHTQGSLLGSETMKYICCITSVREVPDYLTTNRAQGHKARKARKQGTCFNIPQTESSVNSSQKGTLIMEFDHDESLEMEASSVASDPESYISSESSVNSPQKETLIMESDHDESLEMEVSSVASDAESYISSESSVNSSQNETLIMESDHDESLEMEASSVASDAESYILALIREEVPDYVTTHGPQPYEARKATNLGTAIDLPQMESFINLPQKETFITESENDLEMVRAEASLKLRKNGSSDNNWMSSFVCLEKHPLSHRQDPMSVYVAKAILGLVLFIFFSRQVLIVH